MAAVWLMPYLSVFAMGKGIPIAPWMHLIFFCYVCARIFQDVRRPIKVTTAS
jgi:hypothetical protein